MQRFLPLAAVLLWMPIVHLALLAQAKQAQGDEQPVDPVAHAFFEKQVRPLLVEHCIECHGPKKQEAGLRLDSREALLRGSDNGVVLKPGEPDKSLLIEAVRYSENLQMPPAAQLPAADISSLVEWVKQGAVWPAEANTASRDPDAWRTHWAFQPVQKPVVPERTPESAWQTPIDYFIQQKLIANGLKPAPQADRRTLLRRASFDLLGLPPTAEDVAAFEQDQAPDAFAKVVDRLLASPHYGERWGRYWLDVARYADTKGYVFFEDANYPWAYTYRDYVVRSLNEDLPYDRFITEQIAADLLPPGSDQRALAALGFLTVGDHFMNNLHDILDDQIDVVTRGVLGMTVTCARCHDHKFDPIPTADYYALYGVFRSSAEPTVAPLFQPPPGTEAYQKYAAELAVREGKLKEFVDAKRDELALSARTRVADYLKAAYDGRTKPKMDDFMLIADPGEVNPWVVVRYINYLDQTRQREDAVWKPWHALADLPADAFVSEAQVLAARFAAAGGAAGEETLALVREAVFNPPPQSMAEVNDRYAKLLVKIDSEWQELIKARAAANMPAPERLEDPQAETLRQVLYSMDSPANIPRMFGWSFLTLLPDRASQGAYTGLLKSVEEQLFKAEGAPPRAMALVDADVSFQPRVFVRGNPNRQGEVVPKRFLKVLSPEERPPFSQGSGRLELAQSLTSKSNPLTARVIVNRLWQHHFGTGLVRTPSDFGLRSEPPSHPELLDYLATRLMEQGWSLKGLHREIMLSATYQQASDNRDDALLVDSENRLLWKMNRQRLDFEALRDSLLEVSGSLDRTIGGPAVPMFAGEFAVRRTIYGNIDRMNVPGVLSTFDFPSPTATSEQRAETTVPPQALYLMNNGFTLEIAKRLLQRPDVASIATSDGKLDRVYRIVFARPPHEDELALARKFLGEQPTADRWTQWVHALLLTNEFAFVD